MLHLIALQLVSRMSVAEVKSETQAALEHRQISAPRRRVTFFLQVLLVPAYSIPLVLQEYSPPK